MSEVTRIEVDEERDAITFFLYDGGVMRLYLCGAMNIFEKGFETETTSKPINHNPQAITEVIFKALIGEVDE